ncbi:DNA-binding protein WhiA [Corynebacterium sp. 335C]
MALTSNVKDELARVAVSQDDVRKSEVASLLRFAGGLHVVAGRIVLEAEVASGAVARRLIGFVHDLQGVDAELLALGPGGLRRSTRYVVRITDGAEELARSTGLIDRAGRPVRGLPPRIIGGTVLDAEAAWRGAFLVHGTLTEPGRSSALEVACPAPEAALALVGCARRLGLSAKTRETKTGERVVLRDAEAIGALLTRMGAQKTRLEWEEQRMRREVRNNANRLANFDDANLRRSARAAVIAAARIERAMEILGDEAPDHLVAAGRLRVENKHATLDEIGRLANPPMTKDAIAGRIRRLTTMADKRARELGIPDTTAAVPDDLPDEA